FVSRAVFVGDRGAAFPEREKWVNTAQLRHHVHAHVGGVGMMAAEMDGVSAFEKFGGEGRHGDALGLKFLKRSGEAPEIFRVGEDEEVGVATKLRCAVKHAGLAAHQQGTDLARCHRRKDFLNPARDQATLLWPESAPTTRRWRAS